MSKERVYIAGRYSRRQEFCRYRRDLLLAGYQVQARWLDGNHQVGTFGTALGDNGEVLGGEELSAQFACEDFDDVTGCDICIAHTEVPRKPSTNRGGRHVELGIALALQKRVIVCGPRENVFCWHPRVEAVFPDWASVLEYLVVDP